jgi:hypothetical protein
VCVSVCVCGCVRARVRACVSVCTRACAPTVPPLRSCCTEPRGRAGPGVLVVAPMSHASRTFIGRCALCCYGCVALPHVRYVLHCTCALYCHVCVVLPGVRCTATGVLHCQMSAALPDVSCTAWCVLYCQVCVALPGVRCFARCAAHCQLCAIRYVYCQVLEDQPTMFDNCMRLSDTYRLRWSVPAPFVLVRIIRTPALITHTPYSDYPYPLL